MDRCLVIEKKKENKSKERKTRADGTYGYERKRARVGTPELIVAEERRCEMSLTPRETVCCLLFADCCVAVDETVMLVKGMLALASSFIRSRDVFPCPLSWTGRPSASDLAFSHVGYSLAQMPTRNFRCNHDTEHWDTGGSSQITTQPPHPCLGLDTPGYPQDILIPD